MRSRPACFVADPRGGSSGVTVGSTASIFEIYRQESCYLWEKRLVPHPVNASYTVVAPDLLQPVFTLPWGGTSLPVFYENDPRVRSCISSVGFYDNDVMKLVHALGQKWESEYKDLPKEAQDQVIKGLVDSTTPGMPPRERTTLSRTVDLAIGRGQLAAVRATVRGVTPYISTGALQVAAVQKLLDGETARVGFASACKAFGHRYLLGFLEQRGLAQRHVVPPGAREIRGRTAWRSSISSTAAGASTPRVRPTSRRTAPTASTRSGG